MHRFLILVILIGAGSLVKAASIDDSTASQLLASCQLHDYGELDIPAEHRESLTAWAKEKGPSGFDALADQASLGSKALALFDITATDAEYFEISLSALEKFDRESLPESFLSAILMPTERKRGLLAINYRDDSLRTALASCLKKLSPESPLANLIRLTLNGEQAKSVVKHAGDGGYPERYGPLAKEALSGKVPNLSGRSSNRRNPTNDATSQQSTNGALPSDEGNRLNKIESPTRWWPWLTGVLAVMVVVWTMFKRRS